MQIRYICSVSSLKKNIIGYIINLTILNVFIFWLLINGGRGSYIVDELT